MTVQDLINEALGHIGVYTGSPLDASDLQSAFATFVGIVDGWQLEPLTFGQVAVATFSTVAGKSAYTIGTANTNDCVTAFVPQEFEAITQTVSGIETPVRVDNDIEWAAIGIKSLQSMFVSDAWIQYGAISHTLNVFPVPNAGTTITLYLPQQLSKPTATTATLVLPAGYQEPLTFELAIKASSKFGASIPAWLPVAWQESKARVKAANWESFDLNCDAALLRQGARTPAPSIRFYTGN